MDLMDGMDGMDGMDSEPRSAAAAVGDWRERGDREALQLRWASIVTLAARYRLFSTIAAS